MHAYACGLAQSCHHDFLLALHGVAARCLQINLSWLATRTQLDPAANSRSDVLRNGMGLDRQVVFVKQFIRHIRVRSIQLEWRGWESSDVIPWRHLAFVGIGKLLDAHLKGMDRANVRTKQIAQAQSRCSTAKFFVCLMCGVMHALSRGTP
jgi:hypothetical protein